ncbi:MULTISPECIES: trimethylamine methyltransferase family protein [unclassified Mesorhizobium]|uniref:trimethylamine methyltransferase family protein n=2 Tax=Mesorhizobium TaxID=68287 RepID=UPI001092B124|nr:MULTISPECIES: trimethylamine methyltransferase family protein [unclassified Mesorhizobium]TGQ27535.1 trimethylamine methyltransferase [Mesorhizobium sp. M4B.F.Ca.ET.214.01.1.1]TGQ55383.1 trimethylamine methyltransferase [Mesorhizobium sp. M4B.F.Ca.ET.211.01.1.1]TGU27948.1 trimethylamine methyltransferase [Mesorhizobium sp. M4B.F.Ca.ET.150.01.1.1]TIX12658.1 MAG: trimethylamine methyltransferase [Mesorhizobium sp.]
MSEAMRRRQGRDKRKADRIEKRSSIRLPHVTNTLPFTEVLDEENFTRVHNAAMTVLEEIGIAFRCDRAIEDWKRAGAKVRGNLVFPDRHMIADLIAKAPKCWEFASRNPERRVKFGGRDAVFCPAQGAPYVRDLDGVRRSSTLADVHALNKIVQMSPCYQISSGFHAEAMDIAVPHRHLEWVRSTLIYTDMPFFGVPNIPDYVLDSLEMTRIVHGHEFVANNAVTINHINCVSPRMWDDVLLQCARNYADAGQVCLMSPFVLAAANAPADIAATLAQMSAEALAGIAYMQLYKPGTKCVLGQFTVSTSMKSGAPMAGTPEISLIQYGIGQIARHYGLPWRTTAAQASSKVFDGQSGYESAMAMFTGITAGANLMLHAGGWDEGGLVTCYGKLVVEAEQSMLYHRLARGVSLDRLDAAMEAVRRTEPQGHYLGDPFTLEVFEDSFMMPQLFDYDSYPQWKANGEKDLAQRARERARQILAEYEQPPLDEAVREELDAFVERRKREIAT